jgi:hypothetical protein
MQVRTFFDNKRKRSGEVDGSHYKHKAAKNCTN